MNIKQEWIRLINLETKLSFVRHSLLAGITICAASLLIDVQITNDFYFFQRSGAVLCFFAILAEFRINRVKEKITITDSDFRHLKNLDLIHLNFHDTNYCKGLQMLAHICLGLGTLIWGYGDIPFRQI